MAKIPRTKMNQMLHDAVKRLKKMTPAERARLLVESGSVPPDQETDVAAKLAAADLAEAQMRLGQKQVLVPGGLDIVRTSDR